MLSVVIPTLGGSQINDTILAIQRSTQTPDEILICIPQSHELLLEDEVMMPIAYKILVRNITKSKISS